MKKLIFLLCLCLCLNGVSAMAEAGEPAEQAVAAETSDNSEEEARKAEEEAQRAAEEAARKAEEEAQRAAEEAARKAEEEAQRAAEEEARKAEEEAQRAAEEAARKAEEEAQKAAEEEARKAEEEAQKAAEEEARKAEEEAQKAAEAEASEKEEPAQADSGETAPAESAPQAGQPEQPGEEARTEQVEQQPEAPQAGQPGDAEQPGEGGQPEQPEQPGEAAQPEDKAGAKDTGAEAAEADKYAPATELPEDAEAWFERDGAKLGGTLAETLELLNGGEKVYIRAKKALLAESAPLKLLSQAELLPDETAFPGGGFVVNISKDNPETVESPALIALAELAQCAPEERGPLYIWVAEAPAPEVPQEQPAEEARQPEASPEAEPTAEPAPVLSVTAESYDGAAWSRIAPTFALYGIPEGKAWSYAAIIYDERIIPLSENTYVPGDEGVYTVRFAMLDEIGDIVCASEPYTLRLDWTAPEKVTVRVDDEQDYTLSVAASDSVSGVKRISLNGGKKWHKLENGESYTFVGKSERTFAAGDILVEDVAGNVYESEAKYAVTKLEDEEEEEEDDEGGSSGGGGGSDGGEKKPVVGHAQGDGEEGADYDALMLELPEEPMRRLTVGGEPLDLSLVLESAQEEEAPVGEEQAFTATLAQWAPLTEEEQPDTLVLNAELDANLGDQFTYEWRFNGEVYRLLANSGIRYVALRVGDDVCAFPTEGFTGGTKYTELKMLGVSTRKFDYTLAMKVNLDPGYVSAMSDSDYSQECDLSIRTEVENMAYELSSSTNSIMYFYNVYLGPEDMLDRPFGAYLAEDGDDAESDGLQTGLSE